MKGGRDSLFRRFSEWGLDLTVDVADTSDHCLSTLALSCSLACQRLLPEATQEVSANIRGSEKFN